MNLQLFLVLIFSAPVYLQHQSAEKQPSQQQATGEQTQQQATGEQKQQQATGEQKQQQATGEQKQQQATGEQKQQQATGEQKQQQATGEQKQQQATGEQKQQQATGDQTQQQTTREQTNKQSENQQGDGNADAITSLPGYKAEVNFKQYAGYLNAGNKKLHYWLVESQRAPTKDPLLLWLNGGPGCSSLGGLFMEHGPFQVDTDGSSLISNPYSWNKIANVLYLEAPVGTGFSHSGGQQTELNDDIVAQDNYMALKSFFQKFPQFAKQEFYISGESYGGVYVPTLAVKVLDDPKMSNFKGFAIGNGCMDTEVNLNSLLFFIYYHGFMDSQRWDRVEKFCCDGGVSPYGCNFKKGHDTPCQKEGLSALNRFLKADLNAYNIYQNCTKSYTNKSRYVFDLRRLLTSLGYSQAQPHVQSWERNCIASSNIHSYLNQKPVRQALHVANEVPDWLECNHGVHHTYNQTYPSMRDHILKIMKHGKVRGLIYNGDVDLICNFLGDEWFTHKLGLDVVQPYSQWKYDNQIAGFVTYYKNLSFLTLKGSGHMVPRDKPAQALYMITKFLENKKY